MFRAQQNVFDDTIAKATDEYLTSENWELILDVCDKVAAVDTGPRDAVASMIKRLTHRNANVQLYTMELANALLQNCGVKMHRELASRGFTDAVLKLANDRNTHQEVKAKILELLGTWTETFAKDPDLGIMEQAFMKLKSQNPNLQPPSKPTKREITESDRQKEDEELQMALALSIKDKVPSTQSSHKKLDQAVSSAGTGPMPRASPPQPATSGTTAATVSRVKALFDFQPSEAGELQFRKGDIITVLESVYKDWWKGSLKGNTGIFPLNYVEKLSDPTQEELQREAFMEEEVFAEIKNVEKLLTLLSTSSSEVVKDNEEITTLYHSTLAIRPKLIELIGKYSQRREDFTQLNEKFVKSRRDYESLLEASMSQPAQHSYIRHEHQQYGHAQGGYQLQGPSRQQPPGGYYTPGIPEGRVSQHNPPRSAPPPVIAGQPNHLPQNNPQFLQNDPRSRIPPSNQPPPSSDLYHHRPHSTYGSPQELGTSQYASVPEVRPQSSYSPSLKQAHLHQPPPPNDDYPSSLFSDANGDPDHSQPQQQPQQQHQQQYQQQYHPFAPSHPYDQQPQAPPHQPPPGPPSPNLGQSAYPVLSPGPPTGAAYQPFHATPQQQPQQQPGYTADSGGNPNDFYR